jgi:hypothetical protein
MTQAALLAASVSSGVSTGFKNRVINGGMVINQRAVTSGVTSGYFVDRWQLSGCSTSSVLSSSLPTGFSKGISITATSGNPIAIHKIEAANCSDLSGQSVTLSFYAQNVSNATTLYASLAYATASDNFGGTTTISEQNLGTLTGSWVRYTYTWNNLPSGVLNGLSINILCAGSGTFTMGITGVQLEVGTTATNFEFRDIGNELSMCERYYEKSYNLSEAIGSFTVGWAGTSTNGTVFAEGPGITFKTKKRSNPAVTLYNAVSGASGRAYQVSSAASITVSIRNVGQYGVGIIDYTSSGGQNSYYIHYTADSEL